MSYKTQLANMRIWWAQYFGPAWSKFNWKQRKATIRQRHQGMRGKNKRPVITCGRYRMIYPVEMVPKNAQVAVQYWGFNLGGGCGQSGYRCADFQT